MQNPDVRQIGPYEIIEQIGSGGMATVYRAHQPRLQRDVALKLIHQNLAQDPHYLARFEREARIIARLDHPNIVPLYDYNEHEGQPYLVMKFIDGITLKDVLREGTLNLEQIRVVMRRAGEALNYAHEQGVLHRDIKPSNVLIDQHGIPYLTDFGLARIVLQGESTISADMMLGTPQYISPEQAQGLTEIDARADVYSLGVILYELVVGRPPFLADSAYAIVHKQIYAAPPPASELNPEVPPAVERVLAKALSKSPAERYATPLALMDAFDAAVAQGGLTELDADRQRTALERGSTVSERTPGGGQYSGRFVTVPVVESEPSRPVPAGSTFGDQFGARLRFVVEDIKQQIGRHDFVRSASVTMRETAEQLRVAAEQAAVRQRQTIPSPVQRKLVRVDTDYGTDEASIRRRVNLRLQRRRNFVGQAILYVVAVVFMTRTGQNAFQSAIDSALADSNIQDAFASAGGDFLTPLTDLNLALILGLIGAGTLLSSGLRVLDDRGQRLERKRRRIVNELEAAYGPYWQESAGPEAYQRVRRRIERTSSRLIGFFSHVISAVFLTLAVGLVWPPVRESLTVFAAGSPDFARVLEQPVPQLFALLMVISVVIHGLVIGFGGLLTLEPRESRIAQELERERALSGLNDISEKKKKRTLSDLLLVDDSEADEDTSPQDEASSYRQQLS